MAPSVFRLCRSCAAGRVWEACAQAPTRGGGVDFYLPGPLADPWLSQNGQVYKGKVLASIVNRLTMLASTLPL